MIESLRQSIEDLANNDYSYPEGSGVRNEIYLDPIDERVYLFTHVGAGVPMDNFNGIDKFILSVPKNAVPESVKDALLSVEEELEDVIQDFEGTYWDGRNHKGQWKVDCEETGQTSSFEILHNQLEVLDIDCYWEPHDFYCGSEDEIKEYFRSGLSAEDIYNEVGGDPYLDKTDAIAYIEKFMPEAFETQDLDNIVAGLNNYKGNNIWEDVILHYTMIDFEPVEGVDAFLMTDDDGDRVRVFYREGDNRWTWELVEE